MASSIVRSLALASSLGNGTAAPPSTTAPAQLAGNDSDIVSCFSRSWAFTSMTLEWSQSNAVTSTYTTVVTEEVRYSVIPQAANATQCDGLPRFANAEARANASVSLATPIPTVITRTLSTVDHPTWTGSIVPNCTVTAESQCSGIWDYWSSSMTSVNSEFTASSYLTVSVASPPTSIVVNGESTPLITPAPGALPALTLHDKEYEAVDGVWTISDATNPYGEITLKPGEINTLRWNWLDQDINWFPQAGNFCTSQPSSPDDDPQGDSCAREECTIGGDHVELIYFPPPSTSRDLCANTKPGFDSYSVDIYSQAHASTVINSTTFWQDKAYLRYSAVSAWKRCGTTIVPVGGTHTARVVEVESSDISSICGFTGAPRPPFNRIIAATPKPYNFDDLVGELPASAYMCMPGCGGSSSACEEIVTDIFKPWLAVPLAVRSVDPAWGSCGPVFYGVPDPPIALATLTGMFSNTVPAEPGQTPPPAPEPTPDPPQPTPEPQPQPSPEPQPQPNDPPANPDPQPSPDPQPQPNPNDPSTPNPNPQPNPNDPSTPNPNPQPNPNDPSTPNPNPQPNPDPNTPNPQPQPNPNDPSTPNPNPQPNPNDPSNPNPQPNPDPNNPTPQPNNPNPQPNPDPNNPNPQPNPNDPSNPNPQPNPDPNNPNPQPTTPNPNPNNPNPQPNTPVNPDPNNPNPQPNNPDPNNPSNPSPNDPNSPTNPQPTPGAPNTPSPQDPADPSLPQDPSRPIVSSVTSDGTTVVVTLSPEVTVVGPDGESTPTRTPVGTGTPAGTGSGSGTGTGSPAVPPAPSVSEFDGGAGKEGVRWEHVVVGVVGVLGGALFV